jgi:hypothetical protein
MGADPAMILKPKFVALDSSHWEQWMEDNFSPDPQQRATATGFEKALMDQGFAILFTMHHLVELMAIEDDDVVAQRLRFVQSRSFLSWIGIAGGDERILGDITDVMTAEVVAVLEGADLQGTRDVAKGALLRSGNGTEPIPDHPGFLPFIRTWAREHTQKARTITALATWRLLPDDMPVQELMAGSMREESQISIVLQEMEKSLVAEIEKHGDKRIKDAPARAYGFLHDMLETRTKLPNTVRELVLAGYALRGIDADEIGPTATVGEMDALGTFRSQLRVAAEKVGLDFEAIKRRIRPEQLPHRIVMDALQRHGQKRDRRGGGDLYDCYLACLAVYADVVLTDRRTYEDFRQTRQKVPALKSLTGRVEKAPHYSKIPGLLAQAPTQ